MTNRSIYFSRDELAVIERALTLYVIALDGTEFGDVRAEADQGMRARNNVAKSARRKVREQRADRG